MSDPLQKNPEDAVPSPLKAEPSDIPFSPTEMPIKAHMGPTREFGVDFLKAWMILLVLMDHSLTHVILGPFGSIFWERISIPVFLVLMGYNMAGSFRRRGVTTLSELYTWAYFKHKIERFILPYLVLYSIHAVIVLGIDVAGVQTNINAPYDLRAYMWLGYTPLYGPGMWFIPVIFSTILLFPLLYWAYVRMPGFTVFGCFIIEIGVHYLSYVLYRDSYLYLRSNTFPSLFAWINAWPESQQLFDTHILSHLSAVGIGLWLSTDPKIRSRRNTWVKVAFCIGLIYVFLYFAYRYIGLGQGAYDLMRWLGRWLPGDYHLFTYMYAGGIVMIFLDIFPAGIPVSGWFAGLIQRISKATYHILLTQMLYFSIVYNFFLHMFDVTDTYPEVFDNAPLNYLWFYPLNVALTFTIGMLWQKAEARYYAMKAQKPKLMLFHNKILIMVGAVAYIAQVVGKFFIFWNFP